MCKSGIVGSTIQVGHYFINHCLWHNLSYWTHLYRVCIWTTGLRSGEIHLQRLTLWFVYFCKMWIVIDVQPGAKPIFYEASNAFKQILLHVFTDTIGLWSIQNMYSLNYHKWMNGDLGKCENQTTCRFTVL